MNTTVNEAVAEVYNPIRPLVRGAYDLQHLRIQMGNRLTANFKSKLGQKQNGMSEAELEKEEKTILERLRKSYARITDGIVNEGLVVEGKLPTLKKFTGDEVISSYAELVLVKQYMDLLKNEEEQFKLLVKVMTGIPIYDNFLSKVRGMGPALAGVVLSEIDITRAEYPSSVWKLAGLDVITLGRYTDSEGKEKIIATRVLEAHYENNTTEYLAEGKYPVTFYTEGRSRKEHALIDREYTNKDGEQATRRSITFNPFLKTKLVGVLGSSFLRSTNYTVDGSRMGSAKRLELAKSKGYAGPADDQELVASFLRGLGHVLVNETSPYAQAYYDYKNRLENDPRHATKSPVHRHNMAVRYAVKRFLAALYLEWRTLEGLPVATEYSEGVLGKTHGVASGFALRQA